MWTCPHCRQRFVNTNQWHSCGKNTVEAFLRGKSENSLQLYDLLIATFRSIGDFELHPARTRIALNNRMRFAAINRLGNDFVTGHLVLDKRYEGTGCFHKIDSVTKNAHVHHFKIQAQEDLSEELQKFIGIAYRQGKGSSMK